MFEAFETIRWKNDDWALIETHEILREIEPAGSANCSDCSSRHEVEYICAADGQMRGYIHCDDCGREEVSSDRLKRWEIDSEALLRAIFCELNLSLDVKSKDCLWHVGRATWAGSSRRIWFVRSFPGHHDDAVDILRKNPKAVVFAPTLTRSEQWIKSAGSLVIPLESATLVEAGRLILDIEEIEGRIEDAGFATNGSKNAKSSKRGERLGAIEKLRQEILRHLRDAKEHAFAMRDLTGTPVLLRRPTQKELANQLKLGESLVSRCFNDDHADGLRFYWELATDFDRILGYAEPDNEEEE